MDNKELLENKPEVETVVEDTTNVVTKNSKVKKAALVALIGVVVTAGLSVVGVLVKNKLASKKAAKQEANQEETSEEVM